MNNPQGKPDRLGLHGDSDQTLINPATEEKQDIIITALGVNTAITAGRKVVAVSDTAIVLGSAACTTIFITALTGNQNPIVVGDSGVIFTEATRTGAVLHGGQGLTINIDNLDTIFINGVAGDGVSFSYLA